MRLLSTKTLELREFLHEKTPNYAILSHRWGEEEVTFQDVENRNFATLRGYRKLFDCCKRAAEDRYDWVWIDTCCIDKTSSAELSEAINSMYRWYSDASVCYAYLEDIVSSFELEKSKWFSRGWTLQELIAPRRVIFFDGYWEAFGSKKSLAQRISSITGIPLDILQGKSPLYSNVAQRMSWASKRQTTREEDMAYCLMGLFDIHMPPIYGEGSEKAFLRLQSEILNRNSDQTLFLWGQTHEPYNHGLLAVSPASFCDEPRCFQWLFSSGRPLRNPDSPYSSLIPISFGPATMSFDKNGVSRRAMESGLNQVSLGSCGLQISLLQDDESLYIGTRLKSTKVCLDVRAVGKCMERPVILELSSDTLYDYTTGFIPNRLGDWRRAILSNNAYCYSLAAPGRSFTRRNMTISQLRTSTCGPGKPALFRLEDSKTRSFVGGIIIIENGELVRSLDATNTPFECCGAIMPLRHECGPCNEAGGLEIMFGTQQHSSPWCRLAEHPRSFPMVRLYNEVEKLSARFHERLDADLACGRKALGHIFSEEDGQSYVIRIDIED